MHLSSLDILRCPYCGGPLNLVESMFHNVDGDDVRDGILGCYCCLFAVVDAIPVLHLEPASKAACAHVQAGHPDLARRELLRLEDDGQAARFDELAKSDTTTYRELLQSIDPSPEAGYFLYRFSDPTYVVSHQIVRAVARAVLSSGGRAVDLCGGSGHLTRSLLDLSDPRPVLADLYFSKLWLARRFTAPGVDAVCCDGNAPLPFARGAFRFALCADAFMFIWTKRQFVQEMLRLIDDPDAAAPAAAVISHAHNARVWSPSHGNPLPPEGYRALFETMEARLFSESGLFADVVAGGPLDLSRRDSRETLDSDAAIAIVACRSSARDEIFRPHELDLSPGAAGSLRLNPLYAATLEGEQVRLRLQFPTDDYADEFAASRQYLPDEVVVSKAALDRLSDGRFDPELVKLHQRRVIIHLPQRYY